VHARAAALASGAVLAAALGCGGAGGARGGAGPRPTLPFSPGSRGAIDGRPPLAVITREGDGRSALAVAVTTEGLAPGRGATAAVALAALVEARLAIRGLSVTASGGWTGWRLRTLAGTPAEVAGVVELLRAAMLTPVASDDPALPAVARKAAALARRPLVDGALAALADCTGEAYGIAGDTPPTATELEAWRRAAHGLGRTALAVAGDRAASDAALRALGATQPWPVALPVNETPWPPADARAIVYDASGEIPAGGARIIVSALTPDPERAVAAAADLRDPRGPLTSRLAALEAPAQVRSVAATAHVHGGCVAVTIDLSAHDVASDLPGRVATAAALARQEISVEIEDANAVPALGASLAARAADPRDAAERAAWWSLAGHAAAAPGAGDARVRLTVGIASPKDGPDAGPARADAIRSEIDRATLAWHAPVVDKRSRVEPGQGELWLLLASTCGTLSESSDGGVSAEVATAAAARVVEAAGDVSAEPFVAVDGIGILVHGAARPGERAQAHARRLADLAARAFAADALDARRIAEARIALLSQGSSAAARSLGVLGTALTRGHPSWVAPFGTPVGLASTSDEAIAVRAAAMRAGPLRVAILANDNAAQADAAARAVDRWVARRPGEARACAAPPEAPPPRPGTYALDLPAGGPSEALLALPMSTGDDGARAAATWIAAALDGPDGLLARALSAQAQESAPAPLARTWGATVLANGRPPALVVRITAPDGSLDAAVAQTRVLLDRIRQGALTDDDRARASAVVARARLAASLDPRARTIELWRGEGPVVAPSLDALRAFAAAAMRDEGLVIVAARPPRPEPPRPPPAARDGRGRTRL
jgi:hypothetical protein